ncbi:pyridoxal phosphate-dependent aminotransferase family protein [Bacteroidota bacterium]|jgi:glycine C-acetyltransferase|nr:pyridoxal phosphate-dependent aminotransferase family protein [Balneolaceae bacterium]MDC3136435.1 pyridoxal phosphate-dependent aminotransferase family protein [Bacteroidota bacterium]PDH56215.1 MAG: 8-amino-7-oxononanoate synthase [Rhodothermaeota bacterium MED-G12]CAI8378427.1 MAG: Putative pyridoxal phosphate-dependent acyltransferase [Rhodothermaeota bacterium MED-G12]|tara:strand:+ start:184 stop:1410 length:1227 start_codon:yes stop_codon:yes gene_type:complete
MDLFDKLANRPSPLGPFTSAGYGYYTFPKLEGPLGPEMKFNGKDMVVWSINDYLGVGSNEKIKQIDAEATAKYSLSAPMGARLMTGNSDEHEALEKELAAFVHKEDAQLLNFGYQGIMSVVHALVDRNDYLIYDELSHACIVDGKQLAMADKSVFKHNDIESFKKQLYRAAAKKKDNSSILVVTEGVFGMTGDLGILPEIIKLKEEVPFRLLVDDAHGFGTLGHDGSGTGTQLECQDGIDIYFGTFAKAVALIGAFVASEPRVIQFLKANVRSQIFAKSLPLPIVATARERLKMIRQHPEWREKLWANTLKLREGLIKIGYNVLPSESPVTPVLTQGSTDLCQDIMRILREDHGIFVSGVAYPVVPKGVVLIRLIPTAAHNDAHIEKTLTAFEAIKEFVETEASKISA